ncbi:MAG: hypothetical protein GX754_04550, partial [Clostridiaceae bacterium]|nr:hypothetical protein [Clostridiaceae bacterium]
ILIHNDKVLLTHQVLSNGTVENPKVVDYVYDSNVPCKAAQDKSGNIYVFYQSPGITSTQLGYRVLSRENKNWSAFTPITSPGTKCDFPSVVVDNSNVMHVCFQRQVQDQGQDQEQEQRKVQDQGQGQYKLVYKQKTPGENQWSDETIIHSSPYPFDNSSVLVIDEKVIVYWVRMNTIFYSYSNNRGNTWSKPARYNFLTAQKLTWISYNTNVPYESGRIAIRDIPGSFTNGFKLAFYQDFLGNSPDSSADNLKIMVTDYFKYFKESIDTLNNEINTLSNENKILKTRLSEIETAHNNLIKEKEKLSIKLNLLEGRLKQVKR